MSVVFVIDSAAVGVDGGTVWLEAGAEYASTDAVVKAHPDKFTAETPDAPAEEAPKRATKRGRS